LNKKAASEKREEKGNEDELEEAVQFPNLIFKSTKKSKTIQHHQKLINK